MNSYVKILELEGTTLYEVCDENLKKIEDKDRKYNICLNLCQVNKEEDEDNQLVFAQARNDIFVDLEIRNGSNVQNIIDTYIAALDIIIERQDELTDFLFMSGKAQMPEEFCGVIDDIKVEDDSVKYMLSKSIYDLEEFMCPMLNSNGYVTGVSVASDMITISHHGLSNNEKAIVDLGLGMIYATKADEIISGTNITIGLED